MLRIEFTSSKFLPFLPESSQVNPGAYGYELAHWLSRALMDAGIPTSYPLSEDWGWFIEYIEAEAEFMIGCGSQAAEGEGYGGEPIRWHVFVKQHLSLKQRFKGLANPSIESRLTNAIKAALGREGIEVNVENEA